MYPALIVVLALVSVAVSLTGMRVAIRHLMRNVREGVVGPLSWYQVTPQSMNSRTGRKTVGEMTEVIRSFAGDLQARFPLWTRGVASIVWKKETDGLIRLYIGVSRSQTSSDSITAVHGFAQSLNLRLTEMAEPPQVPTQGMVIAERERVDPSTIQQYPDHIGTISRVMSDRHNQSCTIVVTLEDASSVESTQTAKYYSSEVASSSHLGTSSMADATAIMSASLLRGSIACVSNNGNASEAANMLNAVINSINTKAVRTTVVDPYRFAQRRALVATLPFLGLLVLLGIVIPGQWLVIALLGVLPLAVAGLAASGSRWFAQEWFERRLVRGEIAVPSYTYFSLRRMLESRLKGIGKDQHGIGAPSIRQVIPIYAASLTEMMTFDEAALDVVSEEVPQIGIDADFVNNNKDVVFLGMSGRDQPVTIPMSDLNFPLYAAGMPGSGKSNFLQIAFSCVARLSQKNDMGMQITPMWLETKGSGAYDAYSVVRDIPGAMFVDAHNPNSAYRLALEGPRLSEGATVNEVVANTLALGSAMQFSYGSDIRASSREAIINAFRASMLLSEEEINYIFDSEKSSGRRAPVNPKKPNIVKLAYYIIGGDPEFDAGPKLRSLRSNVLVDLAGKHDHDPEEVARLSKLADTILTLDMYLDPKNRTGQERKAAPMNKLSDLMNLHVMFEPDSRQDVYPHQIPTLFAPIVINTGPYLVDAATDQYSSVDGILSMHVLLMFNYLFWERVKSQCSGWGQSLKRNLMFMDEVKNIAIDSSDSDVPNILSQMTSEGRSFGTSVWCASQYPGQMPIQAQNEVLRFKSKFWFCQSSSEDCKIAIDDMSTQSYSNANLMRLPSGVAVVGALRQGSSVTHPFTLTCPRVSDWMDCLYYAPTVQGAIADYLETYWATAKENRRAAPPAADEDVAA